ncbi:hypothetical protein RCL1_003041 [Eukaryota sp. TZLM3-RCL]
MNLVLLLFLTLLLQTCSSSTLYIDHSHSGFSDGSLSHPYSLLSNVPDPSDHSSLDIVFLNFTKNDTVSCLFQTVQSLSFSSNLEISSSTIDSLPFLIFATTCSFNNLYLSRIAAVHVSSSSLNSSDSYIETNSFIIDLFLENSLFNGSSDSIVCNSILSNCDYVSFGSTLNLHANNVKSLHASLMSKYDVYITGTSESLLFSTTSNSISVCKSFENWSEVFLVENASVMDSLSYNDKLPGLLGNNLLAVANAVIRNVFFNINSRVNVIFQDFIAESVIISGTVADLSLANINVEFFRVSTAIAVVQNVRLSRGHFSASILYCLDLIVYDNLDSPFGSALVFMASEVLLIDLTLSLGAKLSVFANIVEIEGVSVDEDDVTPAYVAPARLNIRATIFELSHSMFVKHVPIISVGVESFVVSVNIYNVYVFYSDGPFISFSDNHLSDLIIEKSHYVDCTSDFLFILPKPDVRAIISNVVIQDCSFKNVGGIVKNVEVSLSIGNTVFNGIYGLLASTINSNYERLSIYLYRCFLVNIHSSSLISTPVSPSIVSLNVNTITVTSSSFDSFFSSNGAMDIHLKLSNVALTNNQFGAFIYCPLGNVQSSSISLVVFANSSTNYGLVYAYSGFISLSSFFIDGLFANYTGLFHFNSVLELVILESIAVHNVMTDASLVFADRLLLSASDCDFTFTNVTSTFSHSQSLEIELDCVFFQVEIASSSLFFVHSSVLVNSVTDLSGMIGLLHPFTFVFISHHVVIHDDSLLAIADIVSDPRIFHTFSSSIDSPFISKQLLDQFLFLDIICHYFIEFNDERTLFKVPPCYLISNNSLKNLLTHTFIFYKVNGASVVSNVDEVTELYIGGTFFYPVPLSATTLSHGDSVSIEATFFNITVQHVYNIPYCSAGYAYSSQSCVPCPYGTIQTQFNHSGTCQTFGTFRDYNHTGHLYEVPPQYFVEELSNSTRLKRCANAQFCPGGLVTAGFSTSSISVLPPMFSLSSIFDGSSIKFQTGCSYLHYGEYCAFCQDFWIPFNKFIGDASFEVPGVKPVVRDFSSGTCVVCPALSGLVGSSVILFVFCFLILFCIFHSSFRKFLLNIIPIAGESALRSWLRRSFVVMTPLLSIPTLINHGNVTALSFVPPKFLFSPLHLLLCFSRYFGYKLDHFSFQRYFLCLLSASFVLSLLFIFYYSLLFMFQRKNFRGNFVLALKCRNLFLRQVEYVLFILLPFTAGYASLLIIDSIFTSFFGFDFFLDSRSLHCGSLLVTFFCLFNVLFLVLYICTLPRLHASVLEESVYKHNSATYDVAVTIGRTVLIVLSTIFGSNIVYLLPIYFVSTFFVLMFLRPYSIEYFNDFTARIATFAIFSVILVHSRFVGSQFFTFFVIIITLPIIIWTFSMKSRSQGIVVLKHSSRFTTL